MARVVEPYQAMHGASSRVAVTFAAEIGDVRHFDRPPQLMALPGLVSKERSTGDMVRRSGLLSPALDAPTWPWSKRPELTATPAGSARPCALGSRAAGDIAWKACQWAPKFPRLWAFNFPSSTDLGWPVIGRFRDRRPSTRWSAATLLVPAAG
jgi:Transposase IS116/IS110/IS902 family